MTEDQNYRLLVEAIVDYAIYMLDVSGRIVSWNLGAQRFKGFTAEEVIGTYFGRFYTEEDRLAGVPQLGLQRAVAEGRFESEGWRVRKDGQRFWAHVVIDPIHDAAGELIGFAKVTQDLTERRTAEEILQRNQEQFQILVQGVLDYAIYMLDSTGHVSSWNTGAERIKGYGVEEIIGQHFSIFYTAEDRATGEPRKNLERAERDGHVEAEGWRVRKNGERFWAHVSIERILGGDGRLLGFAKVTRDVTDQRQAAEELETARAALVHSQKLESIGKLTGGVAHDFNNLLMAILSCLELIERRVPDDPKIGFLLENARSGVMRGAALTQRMLAFARRQELRPTAVDVVTLVRGMRELLQRSIGSQFDIGLRFPLELEHVLVDANQLELALMNLTVNARDAMPDGGHLAISARQETLGRGNAAALPAGDYVCLSVADEGEGMDEATLARATEPFFTTKGVGKGTGLGLSMVYGLAEQSGGRLLIHSVRGRGTTVEIWLPVAAAPAAAIATPTGQDDGTPESRPLRIMVVDDDALVLSTMSAQLEDLGHQVTAAISAQQALEALAGDERFDLLITDHVMPGMTGAQLLDRARAGRPDLAMILATGYAELPEAPDLGVARLTKPFSRQDLATAIARAMPGAQAMSSAR